ncbi:MAG: radical SAM protein [Candidatus Tectimicrobiota bacterium]|nr:MAG: radical SAM protein [Candidatus Tectomicrobia bacterium]
MTRFDARQRARQRLRRERGTLRKDPGQARLRVALAYPHTYFVGMSNLGLQTMYRVINLRPDTLCERVFLPDPEEEAWYRRTGTPLVSLESQRPLADFHVIGFSVSYENDYLHVLRLLELAHLPLLAAERDARHPLVLLGGAVTYLNPEPLADFVDLMILGDGEEAVNDYLDLLHDTLDAPREEHLRRAATLPGVYVPRLHEASCAALPPRKITDLAKWPAYSTVLTADTEFSDTLLVEITRGCPWKCRFCTVGYVYPKFRQLPAETVLGLVRAQQERDRASGHPPLRRVGLISSATGDYRHLAEVVQGLLALEVAISISSLRMDRMPEVLIEAMVQSGVRSCTVAPEAGSERLRQLIRKELSEEDILGGVERLLAKGIRDLKLYSMIGLPTEREEDVQELVALVFKIWHLMVRYGRARGALGTLTVSVNPFIPKPATPLQWCAMAPPRLVEARLATLRRALRPQSHIRLKHESLKSAYLEAVLARGDRRLRTFLLATHRLGGDWRRAARELDFDWERFVCTPLSPGAALPWDFLASDRQQQRLQREYTRALAGEACLAPAPALG